MSNKIHARMSSEGKEAESKEAPPAAVAPPGRPRISEVLPKNGLVYSEKGTPSEVLCKPKMLPIKSSAAQYADSVAVAKASDQAS